MAILSDYYKPTSIGEAVQLLKRTDLQLRPLAGGTSLVGQLETRQLRDVDGVVDLAGLGLKYIERNGDEIHIGAMTTLTALIEHETAGALAGGILRRTTHYEGPINLRNAATIGGIVAAAAMESELYAALLALDASVVTSDGESESITALASRTPPLRAEAGRGSLITEIRIPLAELTCGHARIARTPMDRPIVAAVAVIGDGVGRVALCGVASQPILDGEALAPTSDFKGSAEYRQEMATVMHRRALKEAKGG